MAIVIDASTTSALATGATTLTYAHTCTGTYGVLYVATANNGLTNITSVTYNGVAMTQVLSPLTNSNNSKLYLWQLISPTIGANNIVVTASASCSMISKCVSYTGVSQTGQPDSSSSTGPITTTSFTTSTTTVADNTWCIMAGMGMNGNAITAGANTFIRSNIEAALAGLFIVDTNSAQTPSGSKSVNVTSASQVYHGIMISLSPAILTLTDGLLSYHKLEDLTDSVGTRTLTNTGTTLTAPGKIGNGYNAGASNSTKRLGNTTNYGINGGACTLSAWIQLNGNHSIVDHPLAVSENSGANGSAFVVNTIGFNQTNTQVQFSRLKTAVAWQDANYIFTPGTTWHHYVYSYDGTTITGYVDGAQVVTLAASGTGNAEIRDTGLALLGSSYTTGHWFSGIADEVGVWNRAITASEVAQLYNGNNGITFPFGAATLKALVVAGGGSGAATGGGGGSGGMIVNPSLTVTPQGYTITIGNGGNGVTIDGTNGNAGGDSSAFSLTAIGGGLGRHVGNNATTSGSGGGGGYGSGTGGSATAGQGNGGGTGGNGSPDFVGGGGGGAGTVGGNGSGTVAGNGGSGLSNNYSGASVTYAGGGGGGGFGSASGSGGSGGGGSGSISGAATSGTVNTGGGGGASRGGNLSGSGGTGIVIISYATNGSDGISPNSTGGVKTTSAGQTIHTFTSSGTFTMVASTTTNASFLLLFL